MSTTREKIAGPCIAAGGALGVAAVVAGIFAGFGVRLGWWDFRAGFGLLRYAAYGGAAAVAISIFGLFFAARQRWWKGCAAAAVGVVAGALVAGNAAAWKMRAAAAPPIHDITTDIVNPPQFSAILPLRAGAPNPAAYGGPEVAARQRQAYPEVRTAVLPSPLPEAFRAAQGGARRMGWEIVAEDPASGRIEATDTTLWFGFKDDIVVRLTPTDDDRTLVDVRSVSRVGRGDAGTNARRILEFIKLLSG